MSKSKKDTSNFVHIDPAIYERKSTVIPISTDTTSPLKETALVKNQELLFVEWNSTVAESWSEEYSELNDPLVYPSYISYSSEKSLREYFGLSPIGEVTKIKKDIPKSKKVDNNLLTDLEVDESGRALPRVFIDNDGINYLANTFSHELIEATDPLMFAAFSCIKRYLPSLICYHKQFETEDTRNKNPFLWQAIYPQDATGKPVYNPRGKYCVQLFVAGKWRKVTINDTVPINEDKLGLLCSSNRLEIWPILLSKAVYKVIATSGYKEKSDHFGFILHTLTGWLPKLPIAVNNATYMQGIWRDKVNVFDQNSIPDESPTESYNDMSLNDEHTHETLVPLKTRKLFQEDFEFRRSQFLSAMKEYFIREKCISNINSILNKSADEIFVILSDSRYYQVLGIHHKDQDSVSVLVEWMSSNKDEVPSDSLLDKLQQEDLLVSNSRIEFPHLPSITKFQMKWIDIEEFISSSCFLISFSTCKQVPYNTCLGWHWIPEMQSPTIDSKKSSNSTTSKKATKPSEVVISPLQCYNPGTIPFVVIALNTQLETNLVDDTLLTVLLQPDPMSEISTTTEATWKLWDNVSIVLEELSDESPSQRDVIRGDLLLSTTTDMSIPMTYFSFLIPKRKNSTSRLFWLRLFTSSSLLLTFHSNVAITLGEANDVWKSTALSSHLTLKEGHIKCGIPKAIEKILFQLHLQPEIVDELHEAVDVEVFLHLSDASISKFVSIVAVQANGQEIGFSFPRLVGNHFSLSQPMYLIARIYSPIDITHEFNWNLHLVSSKAIVVTDRGTMQPSSVRYSGHYHSNHQLCLFSDVYQFDISKSLVSLRLKIQEGQYHDSNETNVIDFDNIPVIIKIIEVAGHTVVDEFRGSSVIQLYTIDLIKYRQAIQSPQQIEIPKGTVTKKKDKTSPQETINVIISCFLDDTRFSIPLSWRSKLPFDFISNTTKPLFDWHMDIVYGDVLLVRQDISYLERCANIVNSWETTLPGRLQQGKVALEYFKHKKLLRDCVGEGKPLDSICEKDLLEVYPNVLVNDNIDKKVSSPKGRNDNIVEDITPLDKAIQRLHDLLAIASKKDKESIRNRYSIMKTLTPVCFIIKIVIYYSYLIVLFTIVSRVYF